jgi:RNA polymerase sigma-70 factor (ECF subfamily)
MTHSPTDDPDERLDAENAALLEELYERHAAHAIAFLRRKGALPDVAEELVHDSFEKIGKRLRRGEKISSSEAYVIIVVRNTWLDWCKKAERRFTATEDAGEREDPCTKDPFEEVIARLDRRGLDIVLADAVSTLPPREELVLRLHYFEGLSAAEIATRLGIAEGTVRYHLSVGKKRLRDHLLNDTRFDRERTALLVRGVTPGSHLHRLRPVRRAPQTTEFLRPAVVVVLVVLFVVFAVLETSLPLVGVVVAGLLCFLAVAVRNRL